MVTVLTTGTVRILEDAVPVALTCRYTGQCRGAALLDVAIRGEPCPSRTNLNGDGGIGRGDVAIAANATRSFRIPLTSCGERFLRAHRVTKMDITVNVGLTFCRDLTNPTAAECYPVTRGDWDYYTDSTFLLTDR
jgi:hypothetical protein